MQDNKVTLVQRSTRAARAMVHNVDRSGRVFGLLTFHSTISSRARYALAPSTQQHPIRIHFLVRIRHFNALISGPE